MNRRKITIDQCPPTALLKEFVIGALHPAEVELVALHLSREPDCKCHQILVKLERNADRFTTAFAALRQVGSLAAEHEWSDAIVPSAPSTGFAAIHPSETAGDPAPGRRPVAHPTRVGHYRIAELIGQGGMGTVYRARDERLDRDVALKIVVRDRFQSYSAVARFRAEAQAVARLDHPHIVPIYEVGVDAGDHFLAMKLIDGGTLADGGAEYRRDPRCAACVVKDVARAVQYAHDRQILHRDLKPGNILLSPAGVPHVADFGLAKRLDAQSELTQAGAIVGTPSFMAPEQAAGASEEVTTASDVYGLGAVLYYLLTGRPPLEGATLIETCRRVVDTEPTAPRRINCKLDRDLETVCLKCLSKSPAGRYSSAAAVADDLDRYLYGEPILARPVGPLERMVRWSRRRPVVAALVATVLLLATVIGVGSPLAAVALHRQKQVADDRTDQATRHLFEARTALARAERLGATPDRRSAALTAVADAIAASKTIRIGPAEKKTLRNEAIGSLALADFHKVASHSYDGKAITGNAEVGYFAHTAGETGHVILRRARDFAEIARLPELEQRPLTVWFSPGAERAAVLYEAQDRRRSLALWTLEGGEPTWTPTSDSEPVAARFSSDGDHLVISGNDGAIRLIDVETCDEQFAVATGIRTADLELAPHRNWAAAYGQRKVVILDLATGERTAEYVFPGDVHGFAWHPNGKLAAVTGWDRALHLWDLEANRRIRSLAGHERIIVDVSFDRTGELVATRSYDGTTRVWSTLSGRELVRLPGGPGVFSEGGSRLALHTSELGRSMLELWDCSESAEFSIIAYANDGPLSPRSIDVVPDGSRFISAGDDGLRVFDIHGLPGPRYSALRNAHSVACHPDGKLVFVNGDRGLFRFPGDPSDSADLGEPEQLAKESSGVLRELATSADGGRLVAVVAPGRAVLFDLESGAKCDIPVHHQWSGVAISPDGRIVAAFLPRHVGLWQFETGEPVAKIPRVANGYARLTFSPDGKNLIVGDPLAFHCYDVATRSLEFSHPASGGALWGVSDYSPDGRLLAIAHSRRAARLIDPQTGDELCTLVGPAPQPEVAALRFTPDGSRLLVGGTNRLIQVWHIARLRGQLAELGLDWCDEK